MMIGLGFGLELVLVLDLLTFSAPARGPKATRISRPECQPSIVMRALESRQVA